MYLKFDRTKHTYFCFTLILSLLVLFFATFLLTFEKKESADAVKQIESYVSVFFNGDRKVWRQAVDDTYTVNGYTIYGANGDYGVDSGTSNRFDWSEAWVKKSSSDYYETSIATADLGTPSGVQFKVFYNNFRSEYYNYSVQVQYSGKDRVYQTIHNGTLSSNGQIFDIGSKVSSLINSLICCRAYFNVTPKSFPVKFYTSINKQQKDLLSSSYSWEYGEIYWIDSSITNAVKSKNYTGYHWDKENTWWDGDFKQQTSDGSIVMYTKDDCKFYANFVPNTYTITYDGNGATGGSTASSSHTYDSSKTLSKNGFEKEGYHFVGWSISRNGSKAYSDGQSVKNLTSTNGGTVTLYAKWELIDYSISYTLNGGSHGVNHPTTATYNNVINISNPTRTGYKFTGWSATTSSGLNTTTAKSGTSNSLTALTKWDGTATKNTYFANLATTNNGKVSLTANWTKNGITATLYQNYYSGDSTTIPPPISEYYVPGGTKLLRLADQPTRTGYSFKGWNTKDDGSGKYYTSETDFNDLSEVEAGHCVETANAGQISFNLYAIWEANEYSVNVNIYNPNGVEEYTSNINGTFTLRDDEGNVITGLYNEPSDHYITFGKNWQVYDIVAGTGRKLRTTNPVTCGGGLTMSENNGVYTFTCTGTSGHTINIYMEYISYKIAFNGNGSTGGSMDTIENVKYDSDQKLTANGFIKAGYVFTGWNTKADGSGESYDDEESVNNLTTTNGDIVTLYAQWQKTIASDIESTYSTAGTYYINTAADLAKLIYTTENKDVGNGYIFIQTANIDLSNLTYLPIGRLNSFSATYDGQGYTISGLRTYNGTDANGDYLETNGGLFANASGATVKNIIIENAEIYGQNAGIIAGIGNSNTNISNCIVGGTVNGTKVGSIIGNGNGAKISVCLAKGVNTTSFAGGSASIDSCIYEINNTNKTRGKSSTFTKYSEWIYPSNFAYPMPKAFMWYPYPELTKESLNTWINR